MHPVIRRIGGDALAASARNSWVGSVQFYYAAHCFKALAEVALFRDRSLQ
jgi:hypothetical protein